jgi:hypothetical protein
MYGRHDSWRRLAELPHAHRLGNAGVVDEDVESPDRRFDRTDTRLDCAVVGDVERRHDRLAGCRLDLLDDGSCALRMKIVDRHRRTRTREQPGYSCTDALSRSRDQGLASRQIEHPLLLFMPCRPR